MCPTNHTACLRQNLQLAIAKSTHACLLAACTDKKSNNFTALDEALMEQLHETARLLLPVFVTRRGAVACEVMDELSRGMVKQQTPADFANKLSEARHDEYYKAFAFYTSLADRRATIIKRASGKGSIAAMLFSRDAGQPTPPAAFDDVQDSPIISWKPSREYIQSVYLAAREQRLPGDDNTEDEWMRRCCCCCTAAVALLLQMHCC